MSERRHVGAAFASGPADAAGGLDPRGPLRVYRSPAPDGFFTDTSVCIGCKACEVACKEWNAVPEDGLELTGMSCDNTRSLGASTWQHVAFIEQITRPGESRWLMSSDVCKHCTEAGCLDVCPTGALMRTEFGTVAVQGDVCNGCGYCIPACPFGVIGRRETDGGAHRCTLCYDRIGDGLTPACAKTCPTESIQFGPAGIVAEALELGSRPGIDPVGWTRSSRAARWTRRSPTLSCTRSHTVTSRRSSRWIGPSA